MSMVIPQALSTSLIATCKKVSFLMHSRIDSLKCFKHKAPGDLYINSFWCLSGILGTAMLTSLASTLPTNNPSVLDLYAYKTLHDISAIYQQKQTIFACQHTLGGNCFCLSLKDVMYLRLTSLASLHVCLCPRLKYLSLVGSKLISLDISCCLEMQRLDLTASHRLTTISMWTTMWINS